MASAAVVAFASTATGAFARSPVKPCGSAGVSAAGAVKAFGAKARILPVPPNTCEIVVAAKTGGKIVYNPLARVVVYASGAWAILASTDLHLAVRTVGLPALGARADLFDIARAPFFYEEEIAFVTRSSVVVITPQNNITATSPPRSPLAPLAALAAQIHAKLG